MNIFISYHHELNNEHRKYIQQLVEQLGYNDITPNEITKEDDNNLSDEQIRQKIRDKYLKDVDVTIVIVGRDTKNRKFIDWEIYSTVMDYQTNNEIKSGGGIVVINCCLNGNKPIISWILDKELVIKYDGKINRNWSSNINELKKEFNFLPERLLNSLIDHYDYNHNIKIENNKPNTKVHDYPHAVFPIIGYDRLKNDKNPKEILRLAINQARKYRQINRKKWNTDKLRRKDNESYNREQFDQIDA